MIRRVCIAAVSMVLGVGAVTAEAPAGLPAAIDRPIDFIKDIHPILTEHCYTCHAGESRKGGFQLDSREALLKGGGEGIAVIEGNSGESRLVHLIAAVDPDNVMPPKGRPLDATEIGILRAWIDQGVVWPESAHAPVEPKVPLALQQVAPPAQEGVAHPLDQFIVAYAQANSVAVPQPVSDAQFMRRAYLDTIGLLPDPAALAAFEADAAPDKRVVLVDSLLANNRAYAEHWMTFWNDLLRNDYEGTGYIDGGRKQITDWLYRALEKNVPYNEFVQELISPNPRSEGFIKGIVWRGDNAVVQTPPLQAARNIGQVFLGLNLKCASCHDSFTDHWQLQQTFDLANVFADAPLEITRCDVPLGKPANYGFLWPELGTVDGTLPKEARMARIAELVTTPDNGMFPRTIVNRIWERFMGRGLVEPLDTIEVGAWHPELLDWLAKDLVDSGYDLKHTMRTILTSEAYQWPTVDPTPEHLASGRFEGPVARRLTAEGFYDAISGVTGVWHARPKYYPPDERDDEAEAKRQEEMAKKAAGGIVEGAAPEDNTVEARLKPVRAWRIAADPLTRTLGRTNREQITTRRESIATTLQALEMSNGETLALHLRLGAENLLRQPWDAPEALIDTVYREALQRSPAPEELVVAKSLLGEGGLTPDGVQDLLWSVAMLPEFQMIR